MLVGVLSDTHGRLDTTRSAIAQLRQRGAEFLIHCGDVGGAQILDLLTGTPAAFVWGNCDDDRHTLQRHAQIVGVQCFGALGRLTLGERVIGFLHGDDSRRMSMLVAEQECDFLLHGHTHVRGVAVHGKVRVVNPGALHRALVKTVAVIDTQSSEVEFLVVP